MSIALPRIHLSVPHMGDLERRYVDEAFSSNWISTVGPNIEAFEDGVVEILGDVTTLAVTSGTAALHLILRFLGVGPGDDVAVSTLTFAGSVWPILYMGARPVFIDSETTSGNMDPDLVHSYLRDAAAAGRLPKALVVVHLYGQHANLDAIAEACRQYGVPLIEDAAESLGATYKGRPTATTADFGVLSFNGNKMITTSGGGMVVAKQPGAIATMRKWANQSREPAIEYLHHELGYNYRMSNVLAGIGRGQLAVLGDRVRARRQVAARYAEALSTDGVTLQAEASWGIHSRWLSVIYLDRDRFGDASLALVQALHESNIEVRPVWRPMHMQPVFAGCPAVGGATAEELFATGLCLPSSSSLTIDDQQRVIDALSSALMARRIQ